MSELFDDDPRDTPTQKPPSRRSRALLITAVIVVLAIFALTGFASVYTDRQWYSSAGYSGVFSTLLWTKVGLFLAFGAVLGGAVAVNIYLAFRFRPLFRPTSREQSNLDRYRDVVTPIRAWLIVGVALVVGAFAGTSGMGHWRTFLLWRNGQEFGTQDPYFKKDIGYYVFDLPWFHFLVDFLMATTVIAAVAALAVHYLYGGIKLQVPHDRFSGPAQVQLSVLLGLFVLAKGTDYYLDRFDLVNQKNKLFTGMNYTAENAILPAKNILMGVAVICAILFFLNVWRRTWQLPSVGLALLALSAVLLGMIWPAIVQQFQVKPSEADKEEPYIAKNIDATRSAYDLGDVVTVPFRPDTKLAAGLQPLLTAGTSSVPLVDPKLVSSAFENIQQGRSFYSVPPVLDVDRYNIDGVDRALVLGVRELNQSGLSPDAQNWSNLHTVFTHGNGIIAAYANQRDADNAVPSAGDTSDGSVVWAQGTNSGQTDLSKATGGFETRVYYGEESPDYSIVGHPAGASDVELNLPTPGATGPDVSDMTTFDGKGDASVGSTFNQLMFAVKFGDPNFLLSGRVNSASKVLFNRDPQTRVEKVAPWLTVDTDAYPAVIDGRIEWILDGYTTTDRYPNSQRESFADMIDDALQVQNTGLQTLPTDEINYMRNAVKATVDAYTGEVKLYAWDETDPMLKAWTGAFPGTVLPKSEMPQELLDHVRYPEDLFKVQRYQYARYHVKNAGDWYQNNDRWTVPVDPQVPTAYQAPYRLFVTDDTGKSSFSLTSTFVPYGKNNLASFVSADGDASAGGEYGKISVLELEGAADDESSAEQISGPGQVANEFQSDPGVKNDLLAFTTNSGATVTYGNLLTFPIADGLMYVQPVYVQRSSGSASYPELQQVLVKYGDDIGNGPSLSAAIRDLFGGVSATPEQPPADGGKGAGGKDNGGSGNETTQQRFDRLLDATVSAFDDAQAALNKGDLATYQKQVDKAQSLLGKVKALRDELDTDSGTSDKGVKEDSNSSPTASSTQSPTGDPSSPATDKPAA